MRKPVLYSNFFRSLNSLLLFFLMLTVLSSSCKKNEVALPVEGLASTDVQNDPGLVCAELPTEPSIGWRDSSALPDRQINAFFFNPLNLNQIIIVVNGDLFGYNKMYNYDIPTKKLILLGDNGDYIPRVNKHGWIVFNRADLNIYKIKTNGDSLTQLTSNNSGSDPKWDYNGTNIYFFQTALAFQPTMLITMDVYGGIVNSQPTDLANTAVAHQPNKIAYLKSEIDRVSVYVKDLAANSETFVVSVLSTVSTYQTVLSHLTFDITDENLYWSNDNGIFKYNIATAKLDTVKKNCANLTYSRPCIMGSENQLTFGCHVKRAISPSRLLHQYKALELDLGLKQLREVKIFP